jgi:hypothetical protein
MPEVMEQPRPGEADDEASQEALPELAFRDAAAATRWMNALPLSNVGTAYEALLGQLHALTHSDIGPRDRATIAELAREPVAHLHGELARRYAGKPQPLDEREAEACDQAIALWQALWIQYSVCLRPLLEGSTELKGVKAKLLQRALYVGKELLLVHALARRLPDAELWQELHAYYRLAEMLDCTTAAVSDPMLPHAEKLSCYSMYSHALLLGLADPYALSVRQIELADRWLATWARKLFPYAKQRESEGPVVVVDLEGSRGAALVASATGAEGKALRFGYPSKLATSVRGRHKRLAGGASPSELGLGDDVPADVAGTLLEHLDARWTRVATSAGRARSKAQDIAVGGIESAYFRIGGRSFHQVDPLGRDTDPTKYLQTVGGISEIDRRKEQAERNWPWERWYGSVDWRHASIRRQDAGTYHWFLDQLVAVRDEGELRLGHVSRVARTADGAVELSLRVFAGAPKVFAVRLVNPNRTEEPAVAALMLEASPEEPATLVMSPRAFLPNRVMRCDESGPVRKLKLTSVVQRGGDFERVAFEEVDPDF